MVSCGEKIHGGRDYYGRCAPLGGGRVGHGRVGHGPLRTFPSARPVSPGQPESTPSGTSYPAHWLGTADLVATVTH